MIPGVGLPLAVPSSPLQPQDGPQSLAQQS